jgi:hypothetical protein
MRSGVLQRSLIIKLSDYLEDRFGQRRPEICWERLSIFEGVLPQRCCDELS